MPTTDDTDQAIHSVCNALTVARVQVGLMRRQVQRNAVALDELDHRLRQVQAALERAGAALWQREASHPTPDTTAWFEEFRSTPHA